MTPGSKLTANQRLALAAIRDAGPRGIDPRTLSNRLLTSEQGAVIVASSLVRRGKVIKSYPLGLVQYHATELYR